VDGLAAVRTLLKVRMEPRGFAFIGSLTLPFADCSYVVKAQSAERGMTGLREATVMAMQPASHAVDPETGALVGWMQDPYDAAHAGAFMRNLADDRQYDATFPQHPLSKVRVYLDELATGLVVSPGIRKARPFRFRNPKAGFWQRLLG
jgi:hypothetical protein